MLPDPTALLACLAVAVLGILCLALGVGRKRRRRDPTRLYSWSQKQQRICLYHWRLARRRKKY